MRQAWTGRIFAKPTPKLIGSAKFGIQIETIPEKNQC